jgi:hypothetical protein
MIIDDVTAKIVFFPDLCKKRGKKQKINIEDNQNN